MSEKRMLAGVLLTFLILVLIGLRIATAEVPRKINYQGKLTDSVTGDPLQGEHDMTFRLFAVESGGSELWTETQTVTADTSGVVSVILGSIAPIEVTLDGAMWLEVEVDGEILEPRRELVSVPYAFRADYASDADSLGGLPAASYVQDRHSLDAADGDPLDAVYVDNDGNVGVGLSSPGGNLHIYGDADEAVDLIIDNPNTGPNSAERLRFKNEDGITAGIVHYDDEHATYPSVMGMFTNRPGGNLRLGTNSIYRVIIDNSGNVGIGTMIPEERLHVAGDIRLNYNGKLTFASDSTGLRGSSSSLVVTADDDIYLYPDDDIHIGRDGGSRWITIDNDNRQVGVGTISPSHTLQVSGTTWLSGSDPTAAVSIRNTDETGHGLVVAGGNRFMLDPSGVCGLVADGDDYGIYARADKSGNSHQAAIYSLLWYGNKVVMVNYQHSTGTHYKILGDGLASTVLSTSQGKKTLVCPESPEAWIEDYGSGQVTSGHCRIELDPLFLDCVTVNEEYPLKVLVTFTSQLAHHFYVDKGTTGFDVIVVGAGAESAAATFDYKVAAKWKGNEHVRFQNYEAPDHGLAGD